jgi:hypothetical protein
MCIGRSGFAADRPFANLGTAARKIIEIANAIEPVQDGSTSSALSGS